MISSRPARRSTCVRYCRNNASGVNRDMPHTCLVHCINFEHEHTNPANLDTEEARITADIALRNYHHDLRILALFNSRLKQALAPLNTSKTERAEDRM